MQRLLPVYAFLKQLPACLADYREAYAGLSHFGRLLDDPDKSFKAAQRIFQSIAIVNQSSPYRIRVPADGVRS
jgi:hypothetical protein